jgi:asparagine synthase (glutamine-hydrolysing)
LIHDHQKTDVHTFSAVYGEGVYGDESEYINEYRDVLSNLHYTQPTGDDLLNKLDLFVKLHGEPTATTSAFAQFKVFELAKEHVVVVLDGQGADELLAGYHYFFGVYLKYLLYKFNLLKFQREVCFNLYNHRSLFGLKSLLYFALPVSMKTSTMMRDRSHLANDFAQTLKSTSTVANDLYECTSLREALINHFEFKLEHLLKNEDRNSMYFSIESRVPFLDHKLVERTLALDGDQVIHNGMTKYILRRAMKGVMPEKIRMRQGKLGFATPESQWLRSENFREFILDVFHSSSFAQRGYFNQENAIELYEQHYEGKVNKSKEIWKLLNLELWHRAFLDSN